MLSTIENRRSVGGATFPRWIAVAWWLIVVLHQGPALDACSRVSSGLRSLSLVQDGDVHWVIDGGGVVDGNDWLTGTSGAPAALSLPSPPLLEGRANLIGVLPDGSSWWRVLCDDWDPPATIACDSFLLIAADGSPLGRLPRVHTPIQFNLDGTVLGLALSAPARARFQRDPRMLVPKSVELWHGSPLPFGAFDEPADLAFWDDDYKARQAKRSRDGWQHVWTVVLPWAGGPSSGKARFHLRGEVLAVLHDDFAAGQIDVAVFDLSRGSTAHLEQRYRRSFPRAAGGQATTVDGEFALAQPGFMALSDQGELAVGGWQINADCSKDRPAGFVLFDREGKVVADVHAADYRGEVWGLAFDDRDQLWVGGETMDVYDVGGRLIRNTDREPAEWESIHKERAQRIAALNADSPLKDWVVQYHGVPKHHPRDFETPSQQLQLAHRLIVEGWVDVDRLVDDLLWVELASKFCRRHPEVAPRVALARFEAASVEAKVKWLEVLPDCFAEPPSGVREYAEGLRAKRNSERRESAERALARWPLPNGESSALWQAALDQQLGRDLQPGSRSGRAQPPPVDRLLRLFASQRTEFERRLQVPGPEGGAVAQILLRTLELYDAGYVPGDWLSMHVALVEAASEWVTSENATLGDIGAWMTFANGNQGKVLSSVKIESLLRRALAGDSDQWKWAVLATGRALHRGESRFGATVVEIGVPVEVAKALLTRGQAEHKTSREPFSGRYDPVPMVFHTALLAVAKGLGDVGKQLLLEALNAGLDAREEHSHVAGVVEWLQADPQGWPVDQLDAVLDRFDRIDAYEQAAVLDALVRAYPVGHALHERAVGIFRSSIEEALRVDSGVSPTERYGPRVQLVTSFVQQAGFDDDSPLFGHLTPADLEHFAQGEDLDLGGGDQSWLMPAMVAVGPWPDAIPTLQRMLQGNQKHLAAQVLSHVQDPKALDVLMERAGYAYVSKATARALVRYGRAALLRVSEFVRVGLAPSNPTIDEQSQRRPPWSDAGTAGLPLLTLLLHLEPNLLATSALQELLSDIVHSAHTSVAADLEAGVWPAADAVLFLETTGRPTLVGILERIDRLPSAVAELKQFLGDAPNGELLLELLGQAASDASPELRERLLQMIEPFSADEYLDIAVLRERLLKPDILDEAR